MLRKIIVFLAASSLSLLLFFMAASTMVAMTLTPAKFKSWLKQSTVYDTVVDGVLSRSKVLDTSSAGKNSLDDPGVQAAVKKTFTPQFLQSTAEQVIDGTTPWLEGKAAKPNFRVDLGPIKSSFADNIGDYTRTRYNSLPNCPAGQPPIGTDILTVSCKPAGYNAEPDIQKSINDLKTSKEFLGTTVISPDTILVGPSGGDQQPLFEKLKMVPKVYTWAGKSPLIFASLSLIAATAVVFVSQSRRNGLKRLGKTILIVGFWLVLEVVLVRYGFQAAKTKLLDSMADSAGLQQAIILFMTQLQNELTRVIAFFAGGYLALGMGILLALWLSRKKPQPANELTAELQSDGASSPTNIREQQSDSAETTAKTHHQGNDHQPKA